MSHGLSRRLIILKTTAEYLLPDSYCSDARSYEDQGSDSHRAHVESTHRGSRRVATQTAQATPCPLSSQLKDELLADGDCPRLLGYVGMLACWVLLGSPLEFATTGLHFRMSVGGPVAHSSLFATEGTWHESNLLVLVQGVGRHPLPRSGTD